MSRPGRAAMIWAAGFAVSACAFGLTSHRPGLWAVRLVAGLAGCACIVGGLYRSDRPARLLGLRGGGIGWLVGLAVFGGLLAVWYRFAQGRGLLPGTLGWFAFPAVGIGLAEELAYRGFVQGSLVRLGGVAACVLAALAHAGYKTCLFALPPEGVAVRLVPLAGLTLAGGVVFGLSRWKTGSVAPAILAHVAFDVLAYGDLPAAPWWV